MLFNASGFIFIFLPIVLCLFFFIRFFVKKFQLELLLLLLSLSSIIFYAHWNYIYVFLLLGSILTNFLTSKLILKYKNKSYLFLGITLNLILLAYFKYYNFFIENINIILPENISYKNIILPLGISFYTFQQIAFLIDCYRDEHVKYNFLKYFFFVSFFPQLIAGPIVRHSQMMPQLNYNNIFINSFLKNLMMGLSIFIIGLFKKNFFADNLKLIVSPIFDAQHSVYSFSFIEQWMGLLAFSFQIYFDFSAYSDMAIGLGIMFGLKLPQNFNSPYKSKSIIEFWKRMHITLSTFINEYLFYPLSLAFSRINILTLFPKTFYSIIYIAIPTLLTFTISGLWHGASWNFVIWGLMHGFYVFINYQYNSLFPNLKIKDSKIYEFFAIFLTFFVVTISFVPFRAETFDTFTIISKSLFGFNTFIILPEYFQKFDIFFNNLFFFTSIEYSSTKSNFILLKDLSMIKFLLIPLSFFVVYCLKNSSYYFTEDKHFSSLNFNFKSSLIIFFLLILILTFGSREADPFIYYQF